MWHDISLVAHYERLDKEEFREFALKHKEEFGLEYQSNFLCVSTSNSEKLISAFKVERSKRHLEKEISKYDTLQKIVDQLEKCNYESEGGPLVNNIAFISLKRMAKQREKFEEYLKESLEKSRSISEVIEGAKGIVNFGPTKICRECDHKSYDNCLSCQIV
jgi:superfamily I DNA and RNA helicase